ncbi:hypothetical protein ACFCX4_27125, partial [Kitasatospora sp. NPDC056327]|uniref:hypothetical protein n=1 Tax=Kitasatospora sp. NPDC056327 TaxID=3345785 RepID=UPI0035D9C10B
MGVADDRCAELHDLIDRLDPEQAEEVRRHALRLVGAGETPPRHRLSFTGTGVSAKPDPGAESKRIVRAELRGVPGSRHRTAVTSASSAPAHRGLPAAARLGRRGPPCRDRPGVGR